MQKNECVQDFLPPLYSAFAAWDTINSRRDASHLVRWVEGKRGERPLTTPRCPSSKLVWKRAKSYCHLYGTRSYGQRQGVT
ncbi:hypothetical protein TNCV_1667681 [Trichonephila clavipes]|nr:hypothetical protein TNCV_1667681 [Trichonephila clavipes]